MVERRFNDEDFPVVVAHRGASSTHPENTLESFEAALSAGAQMVELDVRLTADGVPVVLHDPDVSRTTDGAGLVHELPFSQVKGLNAGGRMDERAEVPSLYEVLELVSGRGGVNLEMKNVPGEPGFDPDREAVVEAALGQLRETGFVGPVLVSSFNPTSIRRSRELAPEVPTGFLTPEAVDPAAALAHVLGAGHDFVLPNVTALVGSGEGFVGEAHRAGIRVGTWTVDDPARIRDLFGWGVDAVATNDPAAGVRVRAEFVPAGS
jgi:glycerophosphoryl diester phosphodiesterase